MGSLEVCRQMGPGPLDTRTSPMASHRRWVGGSVGDLRYDRKEFKARKLWPSRQFIRDADLEWVTDDSGAEDVDERSGTPDVQFNVAVQGQGVKRQAPAMAAAVPESERGSKMWVTCSGATPTHDNAKAPTMGPVREECNVAVHRPRAKRPLAKVKRPATGEISRNVARLASLAAKARKTTQTSGAGVQ